MNATNGILQSKTLDVILKITMIGVSAVLGMIAWQARYTMTQVQDHEIRLVRIESNRYTSSDAMADSRLLQTTMSDIRNWVEQRYPPEWVRNDLKELKEELRLIRVDIDKLKTALIQRGE